MYRIGKASFPDFLLNKSKIGTVFNIISIDSDSHQQLVLIIPVTVNKFTEELLQNISKLTNHSYDKSISAFDRLQIDLPYGCRQRTMSS